MRISIVIPTYREGPVLGGTIAHTLGLAGNFEVIVSDGGSDDDTALIGRRAGVRVISTAKGRSAQMNEGAKHAQGDTLLFLHADTQLPFDFFAKVDAALSDPACAGGCFRLRFDESSWRLRLVALFSRFSFRLLHYGDQAYFVRRSAFEQMGGFGALPIMEDLDFWLRLRKRSRVALLRQPVTTSARRFRKNGVLSHQLRNTVLVARYLLGANPADLAAEYTRTDS